MFARVRVGGVLVRASRRRNARLVARAVGRQIELNVLATSVICIHSLANGAVIA